MSEERRKRQQERESKNQPRPIPRKYFLWGGIALLFIAAYAAGWYHKNHRYDEFARCMASKQAKMYGLYDCPHCADQKEMFGAAFRYIPYIECKIRGTHELAPECKAAGAKLFPTWQFGNNPLEPGVLQLDQLSQKTGCSLP